MDVSSLPPIKKLFSDSWEAFTKSILNLLILSVIMYAGFILIAIAAVGVVLAAGFGSLVSNMSNLSSNPNAILQAFSQFNPVIFIVGLVVLIVAMMLLGYMMQIAMIIVIGEYKQHIDFGVLFKRSFGFVLPLFVINLFVSLFVFGGFFVFILPALLFTFFFLFGSYELIFENQRGITALRRSAAIITNHFGEILIRILALWGVYILIVVFIPNLILRIEPTTGSLLFLGSFVFNTLLSWFAAAYIYMLYAHSRAATPKDKQSKLLWMGIIAGLGWIIGVIVLIAMVNLFSSGVLNTLLEKTQEKSEERMEQLDKMEKKSPADQYIQSF